MTEVCSPVGGALGRHSEHLHPLTRRSFIQVCAKGALAIPFASLLYFPDSPRAEIRRKGFIRTKLSPFYVTRDGGAIQCELCPKRCHVPKGKRGFCRVRENRNGQYYSLVYGNPCAVHLDPIEKKPFFHVLPATTSLSLATAGCNFQCKF